MAARGKADKLATIGNGITTLTTTNGTSWFIADSADALPKANGDVFVMASKPNKDGKVLAIHTMKGSNRNSFNSAAASSFQAGQLAAKAGFKQDDINAVMLQWDAKLNEKSASITNFRSAFTVTDNEDGNTVIVIDRSIIPAHTNTFKSYQVRLEYVDGKWYVNGGVSRPSVKDELEELEKEEKEAAAQ